MDWWYLLGNLSVLVLLNTTLVILFVRVRYLRDSQLNRKIFFYYSLLYGVISLTFGMRVCDLIWPFKNSGELLEIMANLGAVYVDILVLAYLTMWATIIFCSYRPPSGRENIQGN
jgi:lipid-A-disaccharide synthase-like uncharacterized protein